MENNSQTKSTNATEEQKKRFLEMIEEKDYYNQQDFLEDYNQKFPDHAFANQSLISKKFEKFDIEKDENTRIYKHVSYYSDDEMPIVNFLRSNGEKTTKIYSDFFLLTVKVRPGTEQYFCKLLKEHWEKEITATLIGYSSITIISRNEKSLTRIRKFIYNAMK